jgi:hypothetical protein
MVTVAYLAYGRKRVSQAFGRTIPLLERGDDLATAFSALTFVHFASTFADDWRLVIYTDAPRVFRRYSLPCELVPVEVVRAREDQSGYAHRRKLLVIEHCAESFDGDLFFIDGDTYFMESPAKLFGAVASGRSVLHTREWVLSDETQPDLNRLMREHEFVSPRLRSAQRRPDLTMWNSGVIGLSEETKRFIPEVIDICDELYSAHRYHAMEQFAWSLVLEEATGIEPADDVVYHYWFGREELTYRAVKFLHANRRLPPSDLAAAAAAFRPKVTDAWNPPRTVRARQLAGSARKAAKGLLARGRGLVR